MLKIPDTWIEEAGGLQKDSPGKVSETLEKLTHKVEIKELGHGSRSRVLS
jgi:hypothetical protein